MHNFIIYNGELIPQEDFKISVIDRAFNYGDGVFESITIKERKVLFLEDHFERLTKACSFMKFSLSNLPSLNSFREHISTLLNSYELNNARLKINVWRKEGGLFSPTDNNINYMMRIGLEKPNIQFKENVGISPYIINNQFNISNLKTCNSIIYILSSIYAKEQNLSDVLLLNANNEVVELTSSNVFFKKGEKFYTPHISCGCLEGIMRKNVIRIMQERAIEVLETRINVNEMDAFEDCFSTNVAGIVHIRSIGKHKFNNSFDISALENEIFRR